MRPLLPLLAALLLVRTAPAETFRRLDCRVTAVGPVVIDRGRRDGVQIGDRVFFYPRGGATFIGDVIDVSERNSTVEMRARDLKPLPGMRADVLVPADRTVKRKTAPPKKPKPAPTPEAEPEKEPDQPEWTNPDDEWEPGQPLLAGLKPIRPEERERRLTGRAYAIADLTSVPDDNFDNSLLRVGTEIVIENLIGRGGSLHLDIETGNLTDRLNNTGIDVLLRQLSYVWGGTRFRPIRWEAGRFVQHGMPEFGRLDGGEWSYRFENGHRAGVSAGYMPEPDEGLESQDDFQLAAFYRWVADVHEQLSISAGFQKTWHNGVPDRDLIVAKVQFLPVEGWDIHGTIWIDIYDLGNSDVEVTQAQLYLTRRWASGSGIDISFRRVRFPILLRNEFVPVLQGVLEDNVYDRATLKLWRWVTTVTRIHGELSGWQDEDGNGGSVEGGVELRGIWMEGSRIDLVGFAGAAQFEDFAGGRLTVSRTRAKGSWEVSYEVSLHRFVGFDNSVDDLIQHRVRASATFFIRKGWDTSVHVESVLYDQELSWNLGFHIQRRF